MAQISAQLISNQHLHLAKRDPSSCAHSPHVECWSSQGSRNHNPAQFESTNDYLRRCALLLQQSFSANESSQPSFTTSRCSVALQHLMGSLLVSDQMIPNDYANSKSAWSFDDEFEGRVIQILANIFSRFLACSSSNCGLFKCSRRFSSGTSNWTYVFEVVVRILFGRHDQGG